MSTFETPEPIKVTIDVAVGDVRISAGDRDVTDVEVTPSDASNAEDVKAAELTRVELADGRLLVRSPKPRTWFSRHGGSVDVTVQLPAESRLFGALGVVDLHCHGRLGDCRIKSGVGRIQVEEADTLTVKAGAGDITAERVSGHAEVTAASGDVRVGELGSSAVLKNSNGDTRVGVAHGDLRIRAANGEIDVDMAHASVVAKSANGAVRLGDVARGSVVLETQLGDLEVGIREGTAAWLDVSAVAGKVHNELDEAEAPDAAAETVEVRAHTALGQIVIRRARRSVDEQQTRSH
jgi:hypothetical protein